MSKLESNISPQTTDLPTDFLKQFTFGEYMRNIRKAQKISIRELSKLVGKTPTYISDIEKGNNKPPDKELLDQIIQALKVGHLPNIKTRFFDLAAQERGDIPADIKEYVMRNEQIISIIRYLKEAPDSEQIWQSLAIQYSGGERKNG